VRAHLVWDWNGTLFHDIDAVVAASNSAFAEVGLAPLTVDQYREMYCIPIPRFYERMLGRMPTAEEWEQMDDVFHLSYTRHAAGCGLAEGAELLLEQWQAAGRSQSILSMYGHEHLVPLVRGLGIEPRFLRVDGRTGPSGGGKAEHMVRHLGALGESVDPARTVVIGDTPRDIACARADGVSVVAVTTGPYAAADLAAADAVVSDPTELPGALAALDSAAAG